MVVTDRNSNLGKVQLRIAFRIKQIASDSLLAHPLINHMITYRVSVTRFVRLSSAPFLTLVGTTAGRIAL